MPMKLPRPNFAKQLLTPFKTPAIQSQVFIVAGKRCWVSAGCAAVIRFLNGSFELCGAAAQISSTAAMVRKKDRLKGKDRKSTRLNSSHDQISYAVFCLKKKN